MDKKTEFNEALLSLVEYSTLNGNIISKETVHDYFKDIISDESMYDAIYTYLLENKINIEGYEKNTPSLDASSENTDTFTPQKAIDTEKANMFLDMYYDDVNSLDKVDESTLIDLAKKSINKDKDSINKLTEAFLPNVIKISEEFKDSGMKKSDLISEGNLGLFEAIFCLNKMPSDIISYFEGVIRTTMNNAIQNEIGALRTANHIAERTNAVSDATILLAEKLGREATIDELCEYLSLQEDEVRQILKISLDALNQTGNE